MIQYSSLSCKYFPYMCKYVNAFRYCKTVFYYFCLFAFDINFISEYLYITWNCVMWSLICWTCMEFLILLFFLSLMLCCFREFQAGGQQRSESKLTIQVLKKKVRNLLMWSIQSDRKEKKWSSISVIELKWLKSKEGEFVSVIQLKCLNRKDWEIVNVINYTGLQIKFPRLNF